jgi:hypothetical protein
MTWQHFATDATRAGTVHLFLYITSINVTHFMSQVHDNNGRFFFFDKLRAFVLQGFFGKVYSPNKKRAK